MGQRIFFLTFVDTEYLKQLFKEKFGVRVSGPVYFLPEHHCTIVSSDKKWSNELFLFALVCWVSWSFFTGLLCFCVILQWFVVFCVILQWFVVFLCYFAVVCCVSVLFCCGLLCFVLFCCGLLCFCVILLWFVVFLCYFAVVCCVSVLFCSSLLCFCVILQ